MFKFGFGEPVEDSNASASEQLNLTPPTLCNLDDLKRRAPRISYTVDNRGVPRRDLFDVRFELMNLDEMSEEERTLLSGSEDVRKNVYEGGLKVWEGTNDLLELLDSTEFASQKTMELGCGAGIPSCYLLFKAIQKNQPGKFVLADYNKAVLQLLTMPNVVLAWLAAVHHPQLDTESNEIVLSAELIAEMQQDLSRKGFDIEFVAGAWGAKFTELTGTGYELVLASETIYSLDTIVHFTEVLCSALTTGVGLVAAKRVYFGVGGGIVEFESLLQARNMNYRTVLEKGNVGRVVLEVTK